MNLRRFTARCLPCSRALKDRTPHNRKGLLRNGISTSLMTALGLGRVKSQKRAFGANDECPLYPPSVIHSNGPFPFVAPRHCSPHHGRGPALASTKEGGVVVSRR